MDRNNRLLIIYMILIFLMLTTPSLVGRDWIIPPDAYGWDGSLYNTSVWQVPESWNGSIYNTSFQETWSGSIRNATSIVSGRVVYNNTLEAVDNLYVLVDGNPADIYGTTFLSLNVAFGDVTIFANDSLGNNVTDSITVSSPDVHSIDLTLPHTDGVSPTVTNAATNLNIDWGNGTTLNLTKAGAILYGIGEVKINDTVVRNSTSSGVPDVWRINNGVHSLTSHGNCLISGYDVHGNTVAVHTSYAITGYGTLYLDWIFTSLEKTVGDDQYSGIGYRFSAVSTNNLSKFDFECTWELEGNISNKTMFTRRQKSYEETAFNYSNNYSNTAYEVIQSQPPVYHYNDSGALASYIYPPQTTQNKLEKVSNMHTLWFNDTTYIGNVTIFNISYRYVLYCSNSGIDNYTYLLDSITNEYKDFYGIEDIPFVPLNHIKEDLNYTTAPSGQPLSFVWCADNNISNFADYGFIDNNILSLWNSSDRWGDGGNRLATHDIEILDEDVFNVTYFKNKIDAEDMNLTVWLSILYANDSHLFDIYDWLIKSVDGNYVEGAQGDTYMMGYRTGYLEYAINRLETIYNQYHFGGIQYDSYTSSLTNIDYTDRGVPIKPHLDEGVQFISANQETGYTPYTESLGPFGLSTTGTALINPDGVKNLGAVFNDKEYLAYKTSFTMWGSEEYSPIDINYYRFVANKALPNLNLHYCNNTEWSFINQSNQDYNNVLEYMDKRHVIFNDSGETCNGTLWYDNESNTQVLFAFEDFSYEVNDEINNVFNVTTGISVSLSSDSFITAQNNTYRLTWEAPWWNNTESWNGSLCNISSFQPIESWDGSIFNISRVETYKDPIDISTPSEPDIPPSPEPIDWNQVGELGVFVAIILLIIFIGYSLRIRPPSLPRKVGWRSIKKKLPNGGELIIRRK